MGRLTRDPETRYTQGENQMAITRYTLAVDRRGRRNDDNGSGEPQADFIPCVTFGRAAEFASQYFRKGMRVLVSGRIQTGSYTNKDGQKVYTTDVILDEQDFADSKGRVQPTPPPYTGDPSPTAAQTGGWMTVPDGVDDEGLPFN